MSTKKIRTRTAEEITSEQIRAEVGAWAGSAPAVALKALTASVDPWIARCAGAEMARREALES